MKHLLSAIACCLVVACFGQGTAIHEYPWNPDWNNDNFVGSSDLTGFLSAFGSEFGNPPEPCDYDGTPLEVFATGIADGSIILDSIYMEYQLEDVSTHYVLGCPDPITDTLIFSNSMLLEYMNFSDQSWLCWGADSYGENASLEFFYELQYGTYFWRLQSSALASLGFLNDGFFGSLTQVSNYPSQIPFPDTWYLDDDGIHIDSGWDEGDWVFYANYLHILPYWHYAE